MASDLATRIILLVMSIYDNLGFDCDLGTFELNLRMLESDEEVIAGALVAYDIDHNQVY